MNAFFWTRVKDGLTKAVGGFSEADKIRVKKFTALTGEDWNTPPDRFCLEKSRIHPKLIGRFYGENNLKRCALEIRRTDDGRLSLRYAYETRSRSTWSDKTQAQKANRYLSLTVDGKNIGSPKGLNFWRSPDGRYLLRHKNHMEIVMKKV